MEDHIFGFYIDRTLRAIKADLHQRLRSEGLNITPEQWVIIQNLHELDGQSQVELADKSYKDAPTVSRVIDLLCKKGLCERRPHPKDRRKINIHLTKAGYDIYQRAEPLIKAARRKGWGQLSTEDHEVLLRVLNTIYANLSLDHNN